MSTKALNSRRDFIKAGFGVAASVASLGAAASLVENPHAGAATDIATEGVDNKSEWVGAGYLMARPLQQDAPPT